MKWNRKYESFLWNFCFHLYHGSWHKNVFLTSICIKEKFGNVLLWSNLGTDGEGHMYTCDAGMFVRIDVWK